MLGFEPQIVRFGWRTQSLLIALLNRARGWREMNAAYRQTGSLTFNSAHASSGPSEVTESSLVDNLVTSCLGYSVGELSEELVGEDDR